MAIAFCVCALLVRQLMASPAIAAMGVEEVPMKACSGFVWRLQFELAAADSESHSFYAQYWPKQGVSALISSASRMFTCRRTTGSSICPNLHSLGRNAKAALESLDTAEHCERDNPSV
jgi:hypothetical protein